ncbi:NAD-dependent protein deacetylase sirtuin-1 isoform X2 [Hydra vulgaris]|uniref:NAD-dependent protein deacetylase sirtuin-1 isoform X2 n=1 Tax=Hydra vulgaris TaxID=6087 RepID=UPI001F5F132C|nr:NAD-dependent protein deacetylase sirtuin-1 isoform X2 [Hydra vulgaris]
MADPIANNSMQLVKDEATFSPHDFIKNPLQWIQNQIENEVDPRILIRQLVPQIKLPHDVEDSTLWNVIFEIISEPSPRKRLSNINSLDHVKKLIQESKNIIVLTGAGVSVSCGIPDFRSRDGIYARLHKDYPDLPDPQAMFDIHYFRNNPWPFFKFAKEIYPGQFTPSLCHRFISKLDQQGKLLRNYTQNIDTLEQVAGIKNVLQCHGSCATATCMNCKYKVSAEFIKEDIFQQKIPYCNQCSDPNSLNILKPGLIKQNVPQLLINREQLHHIEFDVEMYGNCDDVICYLCSELGREWTDVIGTYKPSFLSVSKTIKTFSNTSDSNKSLSGFDKECYNSSNHVLQDQQSDSPQIDEGIYFLPIPPNKFVFHGAELYTEDCP